MQPQNPPVTANPFLPFVGSVGGVNPKISAPPGGPAIPDPAGGQIGGTPSFPDTTATTPGSSDTSTPSNAAPAGSLSPVAAGGGDYQAPLQTDSPMARYRKIRAMTAGPTGPDGGMSPDGY